ncbi:MAG: hypothetical protein AB8B48_07265 [Pseudomonadales bacterium]
MNSKSDELSVDVKPRDEGFVANVKTKIWKETDSSNPYVAAKASCYGYDLQELMRKVSYPEMLYLLFRGELPDAGAAELFNALMVAFINPGPRDNGSRAAIQASIGKTDTLHVLPIGLSIFAGEKSGAKFINDTMRFFVRAGKRSIADNIELLKGLDDPRTHGFGSAYNGKDELAAVVLQTLCNTMGAGDSLATGLAINSELDNLDNLDFGIMRHGVFAAALADLGFLPKHAPALYQLINAPGILAHGLEYVGKPRNQVPFLSDELYEIVGENDDV